MQVYYQIPVRSKLGISQQNGRCYNCGKAIDDGGRSRAGTAIRVSCARAR